MKKITGYKVLTKDLKAPNNLRFSYEGCTEPGFIKKIKGKLVMCENGLHVYKDLRNLSIGDFGSRVFKVEVIGDYLDDKEELGKYCCKEIKFIKELKPSEVKDSEWAYGYCKYVKDDPEVRKNITESNWAYYYCYKIKDRKEVRKNITDSDDAYRYCEDVKDRPEVRKNITESNWAYWYCKDIKDDPEVRKNIIDSYWAYKYCRWIKDDPEVRKYCK